MQVKRYGGDSLQEALDQVKRDLGPEAIILETKKKRFGRKKNEPKFVVTAAVSERAFKKKEFLDTKLPSHVRGTVDKLGAAEQAQLYEDYLQKKLKDRAKQTQERVTLSKGTELGKVTPKRYIDIQDGDRVAPRAASTAAVAPKGIVGDNIKRSTLEKDIADLKEVVEKLKVSSSMGAVSAPKSITTPALREAYDQLLMNGVESRLCLELVNQVQFAIGNASDPEQVLDQMAYEIMKNTEVLSCLEGIQPGQGEQQNGPSVMALVGPTGVGKSTTVAKIASQAILNRNLKVALVNLDSYRVGAFDQMATYAKILNVPYRSVEGEEDLKIALDEFKSYDLILIDTTGRSQKDDEALRAMEQVLHAINPIRIQLVLSVTTRNAEIYETAQKFKIFRPEGLILSKIDESITYGTLYNVSQRLKLPLVYFTTGQRVPEDIEEATRERVAALMMGL